MEFADVEIFSFHGMVVYINLPKKLKLCKNSAHRYPNLPCSSHWFTNLLKSFDLKFWKVIDHMLNFNFPKFHRKILWFDWSTHFELFSKNCLCSFAEIVRKVGYLVLGTVFPALFLSRICYPNHDISSLNLYQTLFSINHRWLDLYPLISCFKSMSYVDCLHVQHRFSKLIFF